MPIYRQRLETGILSSLSRVDNNLKEENESHWSRMKMSRRKNEESQIHDHSVNKENRGTQNFATHTHVSEADDIHKGEGGRYSVLYCEPKDSSKKTRINRKQLDGTLHWEASSDKVDTVNVSLFDENEKLLTTNHNFKRVKFETDEIRLSS